MAQTKDLFTRLKKMFSTDVIVRNVGGKRIKVVDTDELQYATDRNSLRDRYNRLRSSTYNLHNRDMSMAYQAARLELFRDYDCVGPDTVIPLPDGTRPTIAELTKKYEGRPQEKFFVFTYDHETKSIKLGEAFHPRKKGHRMEGWKVTFDNGQYIIGSDKHPFLMRTGEYKVIKDLKVGESVMPFYQKLFYPAKTYRFLYNFSKGWQAEHKIVAEQFDRLMELNECVHHIDFNAANNLPTNLRIMDKHEHTSYHAKLLGDRGGEKNPFYGKHHTTESNEKRSKTLRTVFLDRDQSGENNPKFRSDLTTEVLRERATEYYKTNGELTSWGLVGELNCDYSVLQNRMKELNTDWKTFKNEIVSTLNHKIVAIEFIGETDVYDLTVEKYQNFATDSCFVHNTMDCDPILASALDIYADECLVPSEFGNVLTIHSNNENIKKILENLFYDILNVEFNLWSWTRNMPVKYDSPIPLLSGEIVTIEELSKMVSAGQEKWIYSVQDGTQKIVPGKVIWCGKNYTSEKITKVTLDDGSILETAPEHPFVLRNGDVKRADQLLENDSLMPFYRKLSPIKGGMPEYEMIYDPAVNEYVFTHRAIAKSVGIETDKKKRVLHHKNLNKYDNTPNNFTPMEFFEHRTLHADLCKQVLHSPEVTAKRMAGVDRYLRSDERRKKLSEDMKGKPVLDFVDYNHSELHSAHNEIRSQGKKEMWKDPVRRQKAQFNMKVKWSQKMVDIYANTKNNGGLTLSMPATYEILKNDPVFMGEWSKHNTRKFHRILREDMSPFVVSNHKVKRVETISETADVYCMTVVGPNGEDDRHNFAMCGKDSNGNVSKNSGVFVKNCKYGDFFLRMEISPEYGVFLVQPISPYELTRIEGSDPNNINYVKYQHDGLGGGMEYESFEIAHFRLISDSNFLPYGKCLSGDVFVDTKFGSVQIKDLHIGDSVWTFNPSTKKMELSRVLNQVASGKKEILRIRTPHNFIDSSRNHPILTFDVKKNELVYKIAEDIKIGDLLLISSNKHKKSRRKKIDKTISEDITCKSFSPEVDGIPDYVDEEFANFFGFMLGDGWAKKYASGGRVCFSLGTDEDQNARYIALLEKYSGKKVAIAKVGSATGKSRSAVVYSKRFYEILKNLGFGDGAKNKRVPTWVFESDEEIRMAVVDGFHNADGAEFTDQWAARCTIELCNKNLVHDLKRLIQLSNIKSSIPHSEVFNDRIEICGVECNRSENHSFSYYPTGELKSQMEKYNFLDSDEFFLEPVRKIEDNDEEETYDIQVDSANSNFIANGIVVHNSMIEPARRVWKQLSLAEDAMLIHRIMRAPEKRIFKIDVGNIPPADIDAAMQKIISQVKKTPYIDERTGDYNLRFNLNNMVEDFYLPVRGGDSGTQIDTLPGMEFTGIDDLEYIKNKMMAALKIPKAFLGYEEGIG